MNWRRRLQYVIAAVSAPVIGAFITECFGAEVGEAETALPDAPDAAAYRFNLSLAPRTPTRWSLADACPGHRFHELIYASKLPEGGCGLSDGLIVVSRRGMIWHVHGDRKEILLDLRTEFSQARESDDNLLCVAFHPQFGEFAAPQRGVFYIFYTTGASDQHRYVLSRFVIDGRTGVVDQNSEQVLIEQPVAERHHVGGSLAFGADGCLYISVGDGSGDNDNERNGQRIDQNLFSGILRIDVDQRGGEWSHPIRRHPNSGRTAGYFIPNGNPFVGGENALEEFWSLGLRNPHRMSFDRSSGRLWVGDVGQEQVEQIVIAERGSNHGWSFREGSTPFGHGHLRGIAPDPLIGALKTPIYEYEHRDLDNSVIGGYVYHGRDLPELVGKYIYGDHGSGRIYALTVDGERAVNNEELVRIPTEQGTITSFGESRDGEILVCVWKWDSDDCRVMKLARSEEQRRPDLPPMLSTTGLFRDVATLTAHPSLVPYEVNLPFWSDGAMKRRWISLPHESDGRRGELEKIGFTRENAWWFPSGTVFVKHFEAPASPGRLQPTRLETRVIVRDAADGIYGITYRWDAANTDATLADARETFSAGETDASRFDWCIPSRSDCLACHTQAAGWILGVKTRQIVGPVINRSTGAMVDQLQEWSERGWLSKEFTAAEIAELPRHPKLDDQTASPGSRARAYLDVNCSHCHQATSGIRANLDLRVEVELSHTNLFDGHVLKGFGIPDARAIRIGSPDESILYRRFTSHDPGEAMPPLARRRIDRQAQSLLAEWIEASESQTAMIETSSSSGSQASVERLFDFRIGDHQFPYFGTTAPNVICSSIDGLRIILPAEAYVTPSAGVRIPAKLSGDFVVAASYQLLQVPRPSGGHGAGLSLVIQTAEQGKWASLQRVHAQTEGHLCVAHLASRSSTGGPVHSVVTIPATALRGRLQVARSGKTLYYSIAPDDSDDFQEIRAVEFTDRDVVGIELAAQNGEHSNYVDALWESVSIRADHVEIKPMARTNAHEPTAVHPRSLLFWALWVAVPLAPLGIWIRYRRV